MILSSPLYEYGHITQDKLPKKTDDENCRGSSTLYAEYKIVKENDKIKWLL